MSKPIRNQTVESMQAQIRALEFRVANLIASGEYGHKVFALNGKIKKLKRELVNFEWLAR